jgi:hypothetical protein
MRRLYLSTTLQDLSSQVTACCGHAQQHIVPYHSTAAQLIGQEQIMAKLDSLVIISNLTITIKSS